MKIENALTLCRSITADRHPKPHVELARDVYFSEDESVDARNHMVGQFEEAFDKLVKAFATEWQAPQKLEPCFAIWHLPNGCQPFVMLGILDDSLGLYVGVDVESQFTGRDI